MSANNVTGALREHLAVCHDLLALAQKESAALSDPAPFPLAPMQAERQELLSRLEFSWNSFARARAEWEQLEPGRREPVPGFAELLQSSLDTIMRVLVLDRENEQNLLRRGLLPARALPPAERQQPDFVARAYHRHNQP